MLFDREVRTALIKECVLKDFIRFGKSFFHISEFQGDLFVNVSFFAVFMNARLRGRQRLFGIGDGRENLVIHVNQIQRFKRCQFFTSNNRGNRIAHVPHVIDAKSLLILADREDSVLDGKILPGENQIYARMCHGARNVDF